MKVIVLNGSPKGSFSVTEQYLRFVEKKRPHIDFEYLRVAQSVGSLQRHPSKLKTVLEKVRDADLVVWSFPVYYMLVCSQYKKFIELLFQGGNQRVFSGKYTVTLSTSIHFFDHTAHDYMRSICEDLDMKYLGFNSPEMVDLMEAQGQKRVLNFFDETFQAVKDQSATTRVHVPLQKNSWVYTPNSSAPKKVPLGQKKVVVLTDAKENDTNVTAMVKRFAENFDGPIEVFNLWDVDIKGGCLGCCRCGLDNRCAYEGKDGYTEFFISKLIPAHILVFAGSLQDRYLSWKWKQFFDRGFFKNHTPYLTKKQFGFLFSGPLRHIPNLRRILEGYVEFQESNLVEMVTDEDGDAQLLERRLHTLATRLVNSSDRDNIGPSTFLGVGGMKIFRDSMYEGLRAVFQADHRAYKERGYYDFPQKKYSKRAKTALMSLALKMPPVRKRIPDMMKPKMVEPLKKIVEKA